MASGNQFQAWQQGTDDTVFRLVQLLGYVGNVNTQYLKEYQRGAKKFGSQVQISRPPRFVATQGEAIQLQAVVQEEIIATVQPPINVAFPVTDREQALFVGDSREDWNDERHQFIDAVAEALAAQIDVRIGIQARDTGCNMVGSPGVAPSTLANILAGTTRLSLLGIPKRDRALLLGPTAHSSVMNGLSGNFVQRVIDAAEMGNEVDFPIAGYRKIVETNSTPARVVGTFTGTPIVDGAGQSGSVLKTKGWTPGDFLNVGDVIHVINVNSVNPYSRMSTGALAQFVVTGASNPDGSPVVGATADAAGKMVIPIANPINPPILGVQQQFQTVDSFPADGAAVTVDSGTTGATFQENLAIFRDSLGFATLPQAMHGASEYCAMSEYMGVELRMWIASDITNNRKLFRADILPAFCTFRNEGMVRITS